MYKKQKICILTLPHTTLDTLVNSFDKRSFRLGPIIQIVANKEKQREHIKGVSQKQKQIATHLIGIHKSL